MYFLRRKQRTIAPQFIATKATIANAINKKSLFKAIWLKSYLVRKTNATVVPYKMAATSWRIISVL